MIMKNINLDFKVGQSVVLLAGLCILEDIHFIIHYLSINTMTGNICSYNFVGRKELYDETLHKATIKYQSYDYF